MKQKYMLLKNDADNQLIIREYSELNKEEFTCVYSETYDVVNIREALDSRNADMVINAIRTKNMYPTDYGVNRIVAGLMDLYGGGETESIEILIDDMDIVHARRRDEEDEKDEDAENIDELLETEADEAFVEDDLIAAIAVKSDDEEEAAKK